MKHLILIAVFLFASTLSFASEIVKSEAYESGQLKYKIEAFNENTEFLYYVYTAYYENGNLKETGEYNQFLRKSGHWNFYHENGELEHHGFYSNGLRHGTHTILNEEGKMIVEANYKYGKKHGVFKTYDPSGNFLIAQRVYRNNKLRERFEWKEDEGLLIVNL